MLQLSRLFQNLNTGFKVWEGGDIGVDIKFGCTFFKMRKCDLTVGRL